MLVLSSMTITAHNSLCSTRAYHLRIDLAHDASIGKCCMENKKILCTRDDLSMEMHSNEGESVSTYPRRPEAEVFHNAVDVVELSLRSTYRVLNVRHLRVLHTSSSVTSLAFLIQQCVEVVDEFRQHDGVVTVMVK